MFFIRRGSGSRASRKDGKLDIEETEVIRANPFPVKPVFFEMNSVRPQDVIYRFYPVLRIISVTIKTLLLYNLPLAAGAVLHFIFGTGGKFMTMGAVPCFWCFGIFCTVYVFSGIRSDAYEYPYTHIMKDGRKGELTGDKASRRLGFMESLGVSPRYRKQLEEEGFTVSRIRKLVMIFLILLFICTFVTIS